MRILIIEDDSGTAGFLEKGLKESGHTTHWSGSGVEGLALALEEPFDAIILDRMLPELDGLSILKTLRSSNVKTPVLLLSALGQTDHRVEGLQAGADDYLVKPFAFSELLARLEAIVRRANPDSSGDATLSVKDLTLDLLNRNATRGERKIELLPREFRILEYLMRASGRIVTRTMLLENVWDYHFDPQTNVVDVHISRLRKKIDKPGEQPLIQTVRGAGYRMAV
ncbi:MAG TPA: response regulator transcription factor [Rhodobacteraceae bacterium]|nr:response regulator transcription factor [Paracoccaceae bacterium]